MYFKIFEISGICLTTSEEEKQTWKPKLKQALAHFWGREGEGRLPGRCPEKSSNAGIWDDLLQAENYFFVFATQVNVR